MRGNVGPDARRHDRRQFFGVLDGAHVEHELAFTLATQTRRTYDARGAHSRGQHNAIGEPWHAFGLSRDQAHRLTVGVAVERDLARDVLASGP